MSNASKTFTPRELRRVGTAATMIAVCGTLLILSVTMMIGHYNPLVHCGPKAVLDGAVIALLIGQNGRWRCLALLGVVYGFVLLLQVGVVYLLPVMVMAGLIAAASGWGISMLHRGAAVLIASGLYVLLAGFGAPIKIYFGTGGKSEPFVWGLWFAEWPLRFFGAMVGVWIASRWLARRGAGGSPTIDASKDVGEAPTPHDTGSALPRLPRTATSGTALTALRVLACAIACVVPMMIESPIALGAIAAAYLVYAIVSGARWRILHAVLGLLGGWITFGLLSFAWHHDFARSLDLYRTLVLRFMPLALASVTLVSCVRPVDLVRLLRRARVTPAVILPLSTVARAIPHSRRSMRHSIQTLRAQGLWRGPLSLLRRPGTVIRALLAPQVKRWANELAE